MDNDYFCPLTKDEWHKVLEKNYLSNKLLKILKIENGTVLPVRQMEGRGGTGPIFGAGGVLDSKGNYVQESAQLAQNMRNRVYGYYYYDHVEHVDCDVLYLNYFIKQWGHFLIDVVSRLWCIDKFPESIKIAYTVEENGTTEIDGNYLEFLSLLGIDNNRLIRVDKVTSFRTIIVPECSILPGGYYTVEYRTIFSKIIDNELGGKTNCDKTKRIYCSRGLIGSNKETGEYLIENTFTNNSFEVVHMENHTLHEQIKILNSAKEIALINGSLAHNLLFIRGDARVYIINKTYRINLHQVVINQISGVNEQYIDAFIAPRQVLYGVGPFIIKITEEFHEFCEDHSFKEIYPVNEHLSLSERFKYSIEWGYKYKWQILKHKPISEGGLDISKEAIRSYYKRQQNIRS